MKIIGYYNCFERQEVLSELDLDVLTNINYSFLLPKYDGSVYFKDEQDVVRAISIARQHDIKIFVSIGGYCDGGVVLNNVFEAICSNKNTVDFFINNVIKMVEKFGFDGIDLDWEYPDIKCYDSFLYMIESFSNYTKSLQKELTITIYHCVKGELKFNRIAAITDEVISKVNWINVMTYDCHDEPNHSSLKLAQKCVDYWTKERNVEKERITIGIPFYAKPSLKRYYEYIDENRYNAFKDFIGEDSQNSIFTTREKTYFARFNCGGIIIWAINYDTPDKDYSLLRAVGTVAGRFVRKK